MTALRVTNQQFKLFVSFRTITPYDEIISKRMDIGHEWSEEEIDVFFLGHSRFFENVGIIKGKEVPLYVLST
jgi:hypothetical protein